MTPISHNFHLRRTLLSPLALTYTMVISSNAASWTSSSPTAHKNTHKTSMSTKAGATWCPEQQIFIGGTVPNLNNDRVERYIDQILNSNDHNPEGDDDNDDDSVLRIFGYGSLCWRPDGLLCHDSVTSSMATALGYKRCWCQKSADHRGTSMFCGIVCTLLSDDEVHDIMVAKPTNNIDSRSGAISNDFIKQTHVTEGVVYNVPRSIARELLEELDFREKGGYARDLIDVVVQDNGDACSDEAHRVVQALLYRGTPDNPAFWKRAMLDLTFAAARIAVAVGPSGANTDYLHNLSSFLSTNKCPDVKKITTDKAAVRNHVGDFETRVISDMTRTFQSTKHDIVFLFGAGSNQYNQLLLNNPGSSEGVLSNVNSNGRPHYYEDEQVHELVETVLVMSMSTQKQEKRDAYLYDGACPDTHHHQQQQQQQINDSSVPIITSLDLKELYAGGGHSGVLSEDGELFLWGWNENGQLGVSTSTSTSKTATDATSSAVDNDEIAIIPYPIIRPLPNIIVEKASLGHTHTMILERTTGRVYAFGDNMRGQVTGENSKNSRNRSSRGGSDVDPNVHDVITTPPCLENVCCTNISAGVFHSAVITQDGELMTFGWNKFGRCLPPHIKKWRPDDGSKLMDVACGYKHTLILDEHGRVWTMGDNRCGQLGRAAGSNSSKEDGQTPQLADGMLGTKDGSSTCVSIDCGWSHCIAICRRNSDNNEEGESVVYGWGRNDKGQLGNLSRGNVSTPEKLRCSAGNSIYKASCGSESTMLVDRKGDIWACGWNEHGNLAIGSTEDALEFVRIRGTDMPWTDGHGKLLAVGGAHFIALAKHRSIIGPYTAEYF